MKFRYLSIFLILFILSIGAVSAAEDISVDDSILGDVSEPSEYIIDDASYSTYFSDDGKILETSNITDGDTLKIGNVTDKSFVIDKNLTITSVSENDIVRDSSFLFEKTFGSQIFNLMFINEKAIPIKAMESDSLLIYDNVFNMIAPTDANSNVIYGNQTNALNIFSNNITFYNDQATEQAYINHVICIENADYSNIKYNKIIAEMTARDIDWGTGTVYPVVISLENSDNSQLEGNEIIVECLNQTGDYPTVYAVQSTGDNASFYSNIINVTTAPYGYGLVLSGNDFIISGNTFEVNGTDYACGIDIESNSKGQIIENNTVTAEGKSAYGIYTANWAGDVKVNITDNHIVADGYAPFALSLSGSEISVSNNTISAFGNYTTGVATSVDDILIGNNIIELLPSNVGNESVYDTFGIESVAVKSIRGSVTIVENDIATRTKGVSIESSDAYLRDNAIFVADDGLVNSYAVYVDNSTFLMESNNVTYYGRTNGSSKNMALYATASEGNVLENNFKIEIPSVDVAYDPVTWAATVNSAGIVIDDSNNLNLKENKIDVKFSNATGFYDTLYAVQVNGGENITLDDNSIEIEGSQYAYGLSVSGENFNVINNYIHSISRVYYANALNVEGPSSGIVDNNTVLASAPVVAYPVYSSMSGSNVTASYLNNYITAFADVVYGMELAGSDETVLGNTIEIEGNKTTGIAAKSAKLTIMQNNISAKGDNLGNTSLWESFAPETVGIKIIGTNASVVENHIETTGDYSVNVTDTASTVAYNYLVAKELFGDNSVNFTGKASVHDNTPECDAFLHAEDLEMYYNSGKRFVVNLTTITGLPIANKTLILTLNGVNYTRTTNANGSASIAINLNSGVYNITTTYNPGENYSAIVKKNTITVLSTIYGEDLVKVFRNASQYYATFYDTQGNTLANGTMVTFNIHGVMYERKTNENGTAKLNINLEQGTYILTAINPNTTEMFTNTVTVIPSIVNNTDLVKYYKNASQYVVTVLGDDGKVAAGEVVTFNINGVFYNRTTNASGQAKLNINLQPGNYTITAEHKGCKVSNNITVLPVLFAEDLVKKYGTSDQFRALLLDGQGNPYEGQNITFNIHGMFYNRTTNADGYAALNIRLSAAVDTYIITSSYNGTNIANKITVVP